MDTPILILGNGSCACQIGDDLLGNGSKIILATPSTGLSVQAPPTFESGAAELLTETVVTGCRTCLENYQILMKKNGSNILRTASTIIISEAWIREPNFKRYRLRPSPAVLSLSTLMGYISEKKEGILKNLKVVFLTGLADDSNPVIMRDVFDTALTLQSEFRSQTYLLTGNLKVAASGLERLSLAVRKSGAVTFKQNRLLPDVQQDRSGKAVVTCHDEATGLPFTLHPDITVVDESIKPSEYLAELSRIFRLDRDADGFIQTENPHRHSVFTNRNGIFAAGPSRGIQLPGQQQQDAAAAVLANYSALMEAPLEKAEINSNECVRCLTCYRVCPYRAVTISQTVSVESKHCEGCGICAAECPREAIRIKGLDSREILEKLAPKSMANGPESNDPYIVVFGCRRSAGIAFETASSTGDVLPLNIRMISVPCAGSITMDHIFSTFLKKADGILILTCHDGNCHSEVGNKYSHQRVKQIESLFTKIGFQKERLDIQTLAANMPLEFIEIVTSFERRISKLGPSPIKAS